MIAHKRVNTIMALLLCVCLIGCGWIVYAADIYETEYTPEYQTQLFGDEVLIIDIQVSEEDWQGLLDNAQAKEWISGDLVINGERFSSVGIRTKGNSSLSQASGSGENRYSLQFKFNKYEKGQTCYGLDAFCVNNMMGDATYMKDYISYDIMRYIGVDAPLTNYASVTVNGESYGFGLALERYDKAYLDRVFNTSGGQLYSVKIQMGQRGNFEDMRQDFPARRNTAEGSAEIQDISANTTAESTSIMPEGMTPPEGMEIPEGMMLPEGTEMPEGTTLPEEMEIPEGMTPPDGTTSSEGMISSENTDITNAIEPTATSEPTAASHPAETTATSATAEPTDGAAAPEGQPLSAESGVAQRQWSGMGGGGMGGMPGSSSGGSLLYTDDEVSSYSSIFDNPVFSGNSDQDKARVITAIQHLNEGTDLEQYFDVDQILRYLAAHTTVVNLDSYSSNMQQNYYIYERDGQITILPWDYGLAFGGYQSGSASDIANFPIDTPVSGVSMEDRPLINQLLAVDEYREKYHKYLRQIAEGYLQSGRLEQTVNALDAKINTYVQNDATAYFTHAEYEASLPVLVDLGRLRAESILGQLDGAIPSTSEGQQEDPSALTDASGITLSALGSMMGGGGMGGGARQEGEMPGGGREGGLFDRELMEQAMPILQAAGSDVTDEVKAQLTELGLTEEQIETLSNMPGGFPGMGGNAAGDAAGTATGGNTLGYAAVFGALMVILAGAIIWVAKPTRNRV